MRHTPDAIRRFLREQPLSGQTIVAFCADHDLKLATFHSWKRKYGSHAASDEGFYEIKPITPAEPVPPRYLSLPSGLRLELSGLRMYELATLILEIDRAHA